MPLRLVLRNIRAHPLRSLLTFGSVFLAVFLLCMLTATTRSLTTSVDKASNTRLWVQSAVSLYVDLPLNYGAKIERVDGVDWLCRWQWFGGQYRDETGYFAQFGCDTDTLQKSYPEMRIVDGSYEAFARNRIGCLIGADLATEYGFEVGGRIPLQGTIFVNADGSAWDFVVEAIYESTQQASFDQRTMFFHYDYLRESLESGAARGPDGVGVYLVKLTPDGSPTQVMADIDALFANGPQRVQTTTEGEFQRQFLSMLGNVPALLRMIGGAVLFAIFFAVLNTMLMAGRERVRDVGVLKALGFGDGSVFAMMVFESVLLCGLAGAAAVAVGYGLQASIARALTPFGIPGYELTPDTALLGIGIALGLGLIAGAVPGWAHRRLTPVGALRAAV